MIQKGFRMFNSYYRGVDRDTHKLSTLEVESLIDRAEVPITNVVTGNLRRNTVNLSDVYILKEKEKEYAEGAVINGVYRPNLGFKMSSPNQSHIVVYNLGIFVQDNGILVVPEGVSMIYCDTLVKCQGIRLPKSLSSITRMKIKCSGTVNLRNVRFVSGLEVEAKKLILPYTLERVSDNGIRLYGYTKVVSERTCEGRKVTPASLGYAAIQDNRMKKDKFYISNRFYTLYRNSLPDTARMFREIDKNGYKDMDDMFIRDYYPYFLHTIVNDV